MNESPVGHLMQLATGYWASAALGAGVDAGLFDALDQSEATAEQLASSCGTAVNQTTALLDALVGLNLLSKTNDQYRIADDYLDLLSPSGRACMLDALRLNLDMYPMWGKLGECVKTGGPAVPPEAHLGGDDARTRRFVMGMHSRALAIEPMITGAVNVAGRTRLLDVGCGPGTFSRAIASANPSLNITLFDLPPVLNVARELTADHHAAARITFRPGSYREGDLPGGHDAVFYCGALHQETESSAAALFGRIHAALEPGGSLTVIDLMLEDDRANPAFAALFSINMKLFNPPASVFTVTDAARLIGDAGFTEITSTRLGPSAYYCITAKRD
jgi:2-polyprenyl-3-methyl-5-hydroxy-6-metoxy-1,4-benzoquinol methylase